MAIGRGVTAAGRYCTMSGVQVDICPSNAVSFRDEAMSAIRGRTSAQACHAGVSLAEKTVGKVR